MSLSGTRVSLIVLNYNGATVLDRCLDSLVSAAGPHDEIIVVDNASEDGSDVFARNFCAAGERRLFIPRASNNYIFGLNDGLAVARGRYVGFLNNDNVFEVSSIARMLEHFRSPTTFAVCPRIITEETGRDQGALTSGYWERGLIFFRAHPHSDLASGTFFAVGGQSLFDRAKLFEIGTIDDLLYPMYHEDVELSWRAWKHGYEIRYAPDAVVWHVGSHASSRAFSNAKLRALVRQNEFLIVWKNISDRRLLAEHICLLPARLIVAGLRGDWPTLRGFWAAFGRLPRVKPARAAARAAARLADIEVLERVSEHGLGIGQASE
jgi:GT2 family glycosyltransferase